MARNAASVFPVPVGETSRRCSVAAIGGQARACAGVGPAGNADSNQIRTGSDSSATAPSLESVLAEHPAPDRCIKIPRGVLTSPSSLMVVTIVGKVARV